MTTLAFTVPVVAHRVFGLRFQERRIGIQPRYSGLPRIAGLGDRIEFPRRFIPGAAEIERAVRFLPAIDETHGSTMTVEKIRAIFDPDSSVEASEGFTVDSIWGSTGIRFALLAIVDEAIDSHLADYVPYDTRLYEKTVEAIVRRARVSSDAVHILFFRELEGRNGMGNPAGRGVSPWILLADFSCFSGEAPAQCWRRWVTITAHELGHALRLPHMPRPENVMYGSGVGVDSREIRLTQLRIAQEAASHFRAPTSIPTPAPHHGVDPRSLLGLSS